MPGPIHKIEFTLEGRLESLPELSDAVTEFATTLSLTGDTVYQLRLLLEELFVNFVSYGESSGGMTIRLAGHESRLFVETTDNARPFNPLTSPAPDLTLDLENRPIGGLGLFFLKSIGSNLSYDRLGNQNVVRFELERVANNRSLSE